MGWFAAAPLLTAGGAAGSAAAASMALPMLGGAASAAAGAGAAAAGLGSAITAGSVIGGMSLLDMLSTGSTVLNIGSQVYQGTVQSRMLKDQARQEEMAAKDREIQRRRRLVAALASQNARAGASNIRNTGSVANIGLEDVRQADLDTTTDRAMTSARVGALTQEASAARRYGLMSGTSSLLDYGYSKARRG